uniref:hypothetical protein n=1 Tax=Flavobacterium sp. TaxID=239 RepID=UPI004049AB43
MKIFKLTFIIVILSILLYSCSSTSKTSNESANDGSSIEKAIKVGSVSEEYTIVKKKCPKCKFVSQGLTSQGSKYYDHLIFTDGNGENVHYYFDINSFFGKW